MIHRHALDLMPARQHKGKGFGDDNEDFTRFGRRVELHTGAVDQPEIGLDETSVYELTRNQRHNRHLLCVEAQHPAIEARPGLQLRDTAYGEAVECEVDSLMAADMVQRGLAAIAAVVA